MRQCVLGLTFTVLCIGAQQKGWHYVKDDPATKKHIVDISAESFEQNANGHTKYLHKMTARIYDSSGKVARVVKSEEAVANLESGTLRYGPDLKSVLILKR
ncbi:MAG: hypothetical protein JO061_21655 [Acidobacteriaceae bacterium]|nr:hypothetical protein [Acidobacteriaceae bacterium]